MLLTQSTAIQGMKKAMTIGFNLNDTNSRTDILH